MDAGRWYGGLKALSWLVLAAMLAALGYAGTMTLTHWSGIGV